MATKHTIAPWNVSALYAHIEVRGPADTGVLVATIPPWGDAADAPDATRANARLIAAAPDMLATLREARVWLLGLAGSEKRVAQIDEVIAKAEA